MNHCLGASERQMGQKGWGGGGIATLGSHCSLLPAPFSHLALLIQQVQDAKPALDELNAGLVVTEVNKDPRDLLGHILLLLQLEDMLEGKESRAGLSQEGTKVASHQADCRQWLGFHKTPEQPFSWSRSTLGERRGPYPAPADS